MSEKNQENMPEFEYAYDKDGNPVSVTMPIEEFENIMGCLGGFYEAIQALKAINPNLDGINDPELKEVIESVKSLDETEEE